MPETHRRIVMLIGLSREARSAVAEKLRSLGWAVVQGRPSNPLVAEEFVNLVLSGREVVLDEPNTQRTERRQWFQCIEEYLKNRLLKWPLYWIGLMTEGSSRNEEGVQLEQDAWRVAAPKRKEGFSSVLFLSDLPCDPSLYFSSSAAPRCRHPPANGILPLEDRFQWDASLRRRHLADGDVVLLFDLNGTLTSHTAQRRSSGRNRLRPGTEDLMKLKERFRLGIFSSSTPRTVDTVLSMFRAHLGEHLFDPELIFCRDHTRPVSRSLQRHYGLKPWDTVKPLGHLFSDIHRVVLFDDDHWKAVRGEEANMVIVPCWESEDAQDSVLRNLVRHVLDQLGDVSSDEDLRGRTKHLTDALQPSVPLQGNNNIAPFPQKTFPRHRSAQKPKSAKNAKRRS